MGGLFKLIAVVLLTAVGLAIFTEYASVADGLDATTRIGGLPVVSIKQVGASGWLAFGQSATGVLVIAQAGAGVVAFVQVGAGLVFGIGQAMASLVAIAQVGIGAFFFLGQGGVGAQAAGQGVAVRRDSDYFKEMSAEFSELLSFRAPPRR